jgi:hypothetical protein
MPHNLGPFFCVPADMPGVKTSCLLRPNPTSNCLHTLCQVESFESIPAIVDNFATPSVTATTSPLLPM